ncbi:MAG: dihydrolipoyl dehydrogenase [Deltaproteobacteria bacterium]|nr:dihydrolipoyl dehydrogenase [Deltaproteobacteria bacterium]
MHQSKNHTADLVVIGAGPGGYTAAFLGADLGMDVTLIDPNPNPGGVCLYKGCIPSKTLLNAARLVHEADDAADMGITFSKPKIDIDRLRAWKDGVVEKLTDGLGRLVSQRKITYIRGNAAFTGNCSLQVVSQEGGSQELAFKHAIIATGSRPTELSGLGKDSRFMLDSSSALDLRDIPQQLLIVGGGYIGLELGTVYATLGSKVTVAEFTNGLLPGADRDLVRVLSKRLDSLFDTIALNTRAEDFKVQEDGVEVTLKGPEDVESHKLFNKVLIAVGRQPNSERLGLETAGIDIGSQGFIKVDSQCRTNLVNVFAIGDVAGEPMLAHKASHEGRVAVEVIAGKNAAFEPATIPAVVFTDPELAWTGLTEKQAREKRLDFQVSRFSWAASGRAVAIGRTDGMTKLIIDTNTQRILGVGIVGTNAGEMITESVLAIEMGANVTDLKLCIHPHPTLTETVQEAAEMFFGTATHMYRSKRKK